MAARKSLGKIVLNPILDGTIQKVLSGEICSEDRTHRCQSDDRWRIRRVICNSMEGYKAYGSTKRI
jgi:hypothetical protein